MSKLLVVGLVVVGVAFAAGDARAQATRTWVSGVGNDANPCTRDLPCKTFAGAFGKTAPSGYITALDAGSYGGLVITKAITIDGGGGGADVLASGTAAIVVNAGAAAAVNLRHLNIENGTGGTAGIKVLNAGTVVVEDCEITGFGGTGGVGILDARTAAGGLYVRRTVLKQNGQGVLLQPISNGHVNAVFDDCAFEGNASQGLFADANTVTTVNRGTAAHNGAAAFAASATAATILLQACVIANNLTGVTANAGTIVVSGCQLVANLVAVNVINGGQALTAGNNALEQNGSDGAFSGPVSLR